MSLRRTAISSVLWSAIENGSVTVVSFLSLILFAKVLGPRDFGVYSVAIAVIEVAGIFTNMFFHDSLIRHTNATARHFNSAFTASIILGLTFCVILYLLFPYCAMLIDDPRIVPVGRVMALALLFSAPASILNAHQSREFGFRLLAMRTLFGRLAGAFLGIAAALFGLGVWALVIQFLAMTALGAATLFAFSGWRPRLTTNLSPIIDLLDYSVGAVVSLASNFLTKRAFIFFAGSFLGVAQAGLLNLAFRLVDTVWAISATALSQVLLPTMSRMQHDLARTLRAYGTTLSLGCLVLFPIFCGIGLLSSELILLLFGSKWSDASEPAFWLSLLVFAQCPRIFCVTLLNVGGYIGLSSRANLITLGYMAVIIAATRLPSVQWALAAWCSSEVLNYLLLQYDTNSKFRISLLEFASKIAPSAIASCIMIVVVTWLRGYVSDYTPIARLLLLSLTGMLAYAFSLVLFGRDQVFRLATDLVASSETGSDSRLGRLISTLDNFLRRSRRDVRP